MTGILGAPEGYGQGGSHVPFLLRKHPLTCHDGCDITSPGVCRQVTDAGEADLERPPFRAVAQGGPWRADTLLASSDWLQLKVAATSHTEALRVLAERGRSRRIRHTARVNLRHSSR
jgi:hypothetical protein